MDNPLVYRLFQKSIITPRLETLINQELIRPDLAKRVIDFGCGVGHHSQLFSHADYLGIEPLESCVARANSLYKAPSISFRVGDEHSLKNYPDHNFDLVFAIGVLHHISDESAKLFISEAARLLSPGGRIVTLDPIFHPGQRALARLVIKQDRGKHVRTEEQYSALFSGSFEELRKNIYTNLIRIPYDHIAIAATAI